MPLMISHHSLGEMFGLCINKNPNKVSLLPQNCTLISKIVNNNVIHRFSGVKKYILINTSC